MQVKRERKKSIFMIRESTKLYRVGEIFMSFNFVGIWEAN